MSTQEHLCPFQMHKLCIKPGDESKFPVEALATQQNNKTKPLSQAQGLGLLFEEKLIIELSLI